MINADKIVLTSKIFMYSILNDVFSLREFLKEKQNDLQSFLEVYHNILFK